MYSYTSQMETHSTIFVDLVLRWVMLDVNTVFTESTKEAVMNTVYIHSQSTFYCCKESVYLSTSEQIWNYDKNYLDMTSDWVGEFSNKSTAEISCHWVLGWKHVERCYHHLEGNSLEKCFQKFLLTVTICAFFFFFFFGSLQLITTF